MRIATWNVNSLRTRIDRVEALLDRHEIDVLALQETKAREEQLPLMGLQARGYEIAAAGTNQWNGVAILSRVGLEDVQIGFPGQPGFTKELASPAEAESRAIGATCGGVRLWSLYVPNGRKPDDPHYVYKLEWYAALRAAARGLARRRLGAGRRLERLPDRRRRLRRHPVQELDPRDAGRARRLLRLRSRTAGSTRSSRTTPATPTGTTTGSASSATAACASTSCSARRRWPRG